MKHLKKYNETVGPAPIIPKPHQELEWWFKDALGETEQKMNMSIISSDLKDSKGNPCKDLVDFYEGRMYQKLKDNTPPGVWVPISSE